LRGGGGKLLWGKGKVVAEVGKVVGDRKSCCGGGEKFFLEELLQRWEKFCEGRRKVAGLGMGAVGCRVKPGSWWILRDVDIGERGENVVAGAKRMERGEERFEEIE
jgi:hypothetical protein